MQSLHRDDLQNSQSSFWPEKGDLPGTRVTQGPSSIQSFLRVPLVTVSSQLRLTVLSIPCTKEERVLHKVIAGFI